MKKYLVFISALILGLSSCNQPQQSHVAITGTVVGQTSGKVYLQKFYEKLFFVIDSAEIIDGVFTFSTPTQLPEIYGLSVDTADGNWFVFLDEAPVEVTLDPADNYRNTQIAGSALQDLFTDYKKQRNVKIEDFIREHPSSLVSAYALYRDFSYRLSADEIRANVALLDSSLWATPYVKKLNELVEIYESVAIGKPAPDFTSDAPDGSSVALSSHIGKGYLLLDFWASWCPPCRRENPLIVIEYNKYKDRGFDIFSVSLDRTKEAWLQGIEEDHLDWTHVSDLRYWHNEAAQLYGVRAIPSNFLIDKDGIIVAKNLSGEELAAFLAENLK